MVIIIPWGYISPLIYSLDKSTSCQLCIFLFLSLASCCLCLYYPFLFSACHTLLTVCVSVFMSLSGFFPHSLNVFFCSHLSSCFSFSLLSSVPMVLTSCPAVEGGRSRGRKGMLILSPQRQSAWGKRKRERERKCHSSEEMRWPLLCVCECVNVCLSPQERSGWQSEWHFMYFYFALLRSPAE